MDNERPTFLDRLFAQKAMVLKIAEETGKDMTRALKEVDRQIRQVSQTNPITGEKATKSGLDD